jgi:nucleotide-binding universal stress UspA family protein
MYRTIIWATDGSPLADTALAEALRLEPARIVAIHVDQHFGGRAGAYPLRADGPEQTQQIERQVAKLREIGTNVDFVLRLSHDSPADTIASVAEEFGADLIVCGTRGLGVVKGVLLGSVAQRLLHIAHCPVLVIPERARVEHAELAVTA